MFRARTARNINEVAIRMAEYSHGTATIALPAEPDSHHRFSRTALLAMLDAAISAANPRNVLAPHLPPPPSGRCVVVGAGKASASMAAALEAAWPDVPLSGTVAVPYGYSVECRRITVIEAGHPVPDANSVRAAERALAAVGGLSSDDLVIALISGGGSAALCLPAAGITLADKQQVNRLLLSSGLDIRTMNAVRRRISAIKGGKLAAAARPASVFTLAISDIPGDDITAIASGPTVADETHSLDLCKIIARLGPDLPGPVRDQLGIAATAGPELEHATSRLIATPAQSLEAAAACARGLGIVPVILGDAIEGESAQVASAMAASLGNPDAPTVFISGGETTVTIAGQPAGRGGRNTEFALALACALDGDDRVWAIAADTDGEDGANLGAAGAIIDPDTLARASARGLDPLASLAAHDSGTLFAELGDLVETGPTRTNVNDFRAILVLPRSS